MPDEQVRIVGLESFRAALREAALAEPAAMAEAHTTIAKSVAAEARLFAVGTGRQQAHFARYIVGVGTPEGASVGLRGRTANAVFWGGFRHTGWYKDKPGPSQFLPWVGQNWEAGVPGQGPYAIGPAVVAEEATIIRTYEDMVGHLIRRAFPL